jgi:hypothetical protein
MIDVVVVVLVNKEASPAFYRFGHRLNLIWRQ